MKRFTYVFVALALMLALLPVTVFAHTEDDPLVVDLLAGQHMNVGNVLVWNDADNLYVKYEITDLVWCITETHLQVATSLDAIPQTKKGNPIPGQFEKNDDHNCVTEVLYTYSLSDNGWFVDEGLYIAAHAVVQKVVSAAPYAASVVFDYEQGLRKDGTAVLPARSVPEQGLAFETGQNEANFFSLGFDGWITVEFACPISNSEGSDIKIVEDTWGSYPLEKAEVYASQDGTSWTGLGEADNTNHVGINTISEFDLDGLTWARYIKIVDTTDPAVHNSTADGFDLNAVLALQDCIQEETAWGDGDDFPGANWATYFTYTVQPYTITYPVTGNAYIGYEDWINGDFDYNDFGMTFSVVETHETRSDGDYLTEVVMTFNAVIFDSGMRHLIHIATPFTGSYSYEVTRLTPYYPNILTLWDGTTGAETPEGNYTGSGPLDVVLFNTAKYTWPQKQINETVIVHVTGLNELDWIPADPPRAYNVGSGDFYDLPPLMANYDPWEIGTLYESLYHIQDTQVIANTANQKMFTCGTIIPVNTEVPMILAVPFNNWIPPYEDTTITGPYNLFDDFYTTGTPMDWYSTLNPCAPTPGQGGLSWYP